MLLPNPFHITTSLKSRVIDKNYNKGFSKLYVFVILGAADHSPIVSPNKHHITQY